VSEVQTFSFSLQVLHSSTQTREESNTGVDADLLKSGTKVASMLKDRDFGDAAPEPEQHEAIHHSADTLVDEITGRASDAGNVGGIDVATGREQHDVESRSDSADMVDQEHETVDGVGVDGADGMDVDLEIRANGNNLYLGNIAEPGQHDATSRSPNIAVDEIMGEVSHAGNEIEVSSPNTFKK
jgi:hypothetical protein